MDFKNKMLKSVEHLDEQLRGIRPGTISIGFLETFRVPYYGSSVPISQVAAIHPQGNNILITPFDKTLVPSIEKSLVSSKLSAYALNPKTVSVSVPPISGDQREDIVKHIKKLGEEAKIAIRSIRQTARDMAKKSETLEKEEKSIQQITDQMISRVEQLISNKTKELS